MINISSRGLKFLKGFFAGKSLKIMNEIINLGIDSTTSRADKKRIRLINGISIIIFLVLLPVSITVVYIFAPFETIDLTLVWQLISAEAPRPDIFAKIKIIYPIINFSFALIALSLLYLNYKQKHRYSIFILCITVMMISLSYYLLGRLYNVFFMLIPSILPSIFYNKKRYYLSFWIINYLLFVIITLNLDFSAFSSHFGEPYIQLIGNMTMTYLLLFLIINYFKVENKKNERKLEVRNNKLAAQKEEILCQHQQLEEINELLEKKNQKLNKLAITDQLTGLYNRNKINEELDLAVEKYKRYQNRFSVIMIDIDYFKSINDQFGHQRGDKVIKEVADYLKQRVRTTDTISRWGGEEFLILAPGTTLTGAIQLAKDIRQGIAQKDFSIPKQLTISLGVSEYQGQKSIEEFLDQVDQKLYQAKEQGRNQVVF